MVEIELVMSETEEMWVVKISTPGLKESAIGPKPLKIFINDECLYENPSQWRSKKEHE